MKVRLLRMQYLQHVLSTDQCVRCSRRITAMTVTLNNLVLSVDPECRPELVAMIGSAVATSISDIPFAGPCATTQMGLVDGEFIVNPNQEQWDNGDLTFDRSFYP